MGCRTGYDYVWIRIDPKRDVDLAACGKFRHKQIRLAIQALALVILVVIFLVLAVKQWKDATHPMVQVKRKVWVCEAADQ